MLRSTEDLVQLYKIEKMKDHKKEAEKTLLEIIGNYRAMIYHHINRIIINKPDKKSSKEDMEQASVMALIEAVEAYDPNRFASFSTYAYNKVLFAIIDWIASDRMIPIPHNNRKYIAKYFDIIMDNEIRNNDTKISEEYIRELMGVTKRKFKNIKAAIAAIGIDYLDGNSIFENNYDVRVKSPFL